MNIIKPKPDPKQLLRDWQRKLRQECRNIDRQIRGSCRVNSCIFSLVNLGFFFRFWKILKSDESS